MAILLQRPSKELTPPSIPSAERSLDEMSPRSLLRTLLPTTPALFLVLHRPLNDRVHLDLRRHPSRPLPELGEVDAVGAGALARRYGQPNR